MSGARCQRPRPRTAGRPIEQFDRVHDRHTAAAGQLLDAADIAGGDEIGADHRDVGQLAVAQCTGQFRLQQIVSAGRAATQMPLRDRDDLKPGLVQQLLGSSIDFLSVLQRAGRVIGDAQRLRRGGIVQPEPSENLADVAR